MQNGNQCTKICDKSKIFSLRHESFSSIMEGYLQIKVKNLSEPKFKSKLNSLSSRWSRKFVQLNPEFLNFYKSKEESDHHNRDFCLTSKELFKASIESKKGAIAIYNTVKNERFLLV